MRWFALILFLAVLSATSAEPDPKKFKSEHKVKEKQSNSSLTEDERKFLREVEAKFGVKSDIPVADKNEKESEKTETSDPAKPAFPAVIAIEIVNDTDSKSKGKRTIDANLGYGYRTNKGYTYTYFGKSSQDKGKFMIYPYSQEDIPPARPNGFNKGHGYKSSGKYSSSPNVEIQPSKAFELVSVKDEPNSYHIKNPISDYKNIKGLESPPPSYTSGNPHESGYSSIPPTTLYTTYNGEKFSGLSGQFPSLMPNYFVNPSQLLKDPQYQNAGLTPDLIRPSLEQRVVPVLVLRIPSSYLKNPTAELYANLPKNYPLSHYLNNANLQDLVNQYFKKIGYSFAPQIMAYQNSIPSTVETPAVVSNYKPQKYATPYVQPSYTQADYSGVQYSAVQPVMAKYPSSYTPQSYYIARPQSLYQKPLDNQHYEYMYQYVPQTAVREQTYYVQPQYTQQSLDTGSQEHQHVSVSQDSNVHDTAANIEYVAQQQANPESSVSSVEYGTPQPPAAQYEVASPAVSYESPSSHTPAPEYGPPKEQNLEYEADHTPSAEYGPTKVPIPVYHSQQAVNSEYEAPKHQSQSQQYYISQPVQKETIAIYSSQKYQVSSDAESQGYFYPKQSSAGATDDSLPISENYPSKDHTIATVLPVSYKNRKPSSAAIQTVSYVTPSPLTAKFQSQYNVMVPQTVLKNPNSEKVAYVNSHSLPASYSQEYQNPEYEYTASAHYSPPVGSQNPPSYPRNYHSHPKRMTRPEKSESHSSLSKKLNERNDKKKSS